MEYLKLNKAIVIEKKQPLYSDFYAELGGIKYPFSVNEIGAEILKMCDGNNSKQDIITYLKEKYDDDERNINDMVSEFIGTSINLGYVSVETEKSEIHLQEYGSKEYWTPDIISIELTHKCPLRCKHCYVNAGVGENIDTKKVISLINESIKMGTNQLQLTGGEPLLHTDFFSILEYALNNKMSVSVFSSGYVIDDKVIEELTKWRNNINLTFQISLDGLSEYHNIFRGNELSFDRAIEFIKLLVSMGICTSVGTCVIDQTYEELENLGKLLKQIGVRVYRISSISNKGRAKDNLEKNNKNNNVRVKGYTKKLANLLDGEDFKVLYFEESDLNINYKYKHNCGFGQTMLKIDPYGNVYPCLLSDIKYANINNMSLMEIQRKYSRIWENMHTPSKLVCKDCENLELCGHCICEGIEYCDNENNKFLIEYKSIQNEIFNNMENESNL